MLTFDNGMDHYLSDRFYKVNQTLLPDTGWTLVDDKVQKLLEKIKKAGIPLGEYVQGKIFYGIKTGLNEAFVIDEDTKESLIKEDPNSAEIIKPFLAGRDIKRYQQPRSEKYLILIKNGQTKAWFGDLKEDAAYEKLMIKYPAVGIYLAQFKEKAKARYDKGQYWWELRACDYYEEFEKPKIMYQVFQVKACFIYDDYGSYCNNSIWILPTLDKILLGILNSKLGWWLISQYCTAIQNGYQLIWKYLGQVPIAQADRKSTQNLTEKISQVLRNKKSDPNADTLSLEAEIDWLVYRLYDLTWEEVKIVDPEFAMSEAEYMSKMLN